METSDPIKLIRQRYLEKCVLGKVEASTHCACEVGKYSVLVAVVTNVNLCRTIM